MPKCDEAEDASVERRPRVVTEVVPLAEDPRTDEGGGGGGATDSMPLSSPTQVKEESDGEFCEWWGASGGGPGRAGAGAPLSTRERVMERRCCC